MKKIISLILTLCLVFSLAACGGAKETTSSPAEDSSASASSAETSSAAASTGDETEAPTGPQETYALIAEQDNLDAIIASSENYSFTKGELAYYFAMVFKDYYSYFSVYGIDASVSLKEQKFSETQTWFDVFMSQAMKYPVSYLTFCEAARDRGLSLTQEDLDYIAAQKEQLETDAANYGWDPDTYLEQMFGTNISWNILEQALQKMLLADRGYAALNSELEAQVSEDDITARLKEDPKRYQYVDMIQIDFLYAEGMTDAEKAELRAAFNAAKDEASFKNALTLYVNMAIEKEKIDEAGSAQAYAEKMMAENKALKQPYKESALMEWVFSEDRSGDVFVEPDEADGKQYAYLITSEPYVDEDTYVDVRHILALTKTYGSAEAARAKAEEIYAKWQAGEKTEAAFASLATANSEDGGSASNGGLYKGVYRGQMVEPFENWCFDENRKPGDTGIVDTTHGSHVMYFVQSYQGWHQTIQNEILNELYTEAYQKLTEKHPLTIDNDTANTINW